MNHSRIKSHRFWQLCAAFTIVGSLVACDTTPDVPPQPPAPGPGAQAPQTPAPLVDNGPLPAAQQHGLSRWEPIRWTDLPGWGQDDLHAAWNAWIKGCEKPLRGQEALCAEVRMLSIATPAQQQDWVVQRFRPYRVVQSDGVQPPGLLTGYYEPIMSASRVPTATHRTPLYGPPPGLSSKRRWYSRRDIDTSPAAKAALNGRAIAWMEDPIDALILQIQGSGRIRITEPGGQVREVRLAFAGHNGHAYQSVGKWLLRQRAISEGSWDAIKQWAASNPHRLNEMLWANPRTVFFREESLSDLDAQFGPKGAQGVPLTPGRSIAVDPKSIPYGTPVWLATQGEALNDQRLVLAQDTGGAIEGSVRADLFTGWGTQQDEAFTLAAALKQPLQLWVLLPR